MAQTTTLQTSTSGPQTPAARAAQINMILAALFSMNAGATEPSAKTGLMGWMDTSADPALLKVRNAGNDGWITVGQVTSAGVWTWWHGGAPLNLAAAFGEIGGLTAETAIALNDELALRDVSIADPKQRKATVQNLLKAFAGLAAVGSPNLAHKLLGHDGSNPVHYTPQLLFNLINGLSAIGTISKADKLAFFDADGGAAGAMAIEDAMAGLIADLTEATTPADDDLLLLRLTGGGIRKVKKSNIVGGADMVKLGTLNLGSGSAQALTSIPPCKQLVLVMIEAQPNVGTNFLRVALSSNNGSSYGGAHRVTGSTSGGGGGPEHCGEITIYNSGVASTNKTIVPKIIDTADDAGYFGVPSIENSVTGIINALRVTPSSGSLDGGFAEVYGLQ